MTISELGFWGKSKLVLGLIFKKENQVTPISTYLLDALRDNSLHDVKIVGRGGVEVSIDEIKNSPQFLEMQKYAKLKVEMDKREQSNIGRITHNSTVD